jgi:hypothetical protein
MVGTLNLCTYYDLFGKLSKGSGVVSALVTLLEMNAATDETAETAVKQRGSTTLHYLPVSLIHEYSCRNINLL